MQKEERGEGERKKFVKVTKERKRRETVCEGLHAGIEGKKVEKDREGEHKSGKEKNNAVAREKGRTSSILI